MKAVSRTVPPAPVPPPEIEIVLTLSQEEANQLRCLVGKISGPSSGYSLDATFDTLDRAQKARQIVDLVFEVLLPFTTRT